MTASADEIRARRLVLDGQVQGVGFRPFVYRLAVELGVRGQVRNQLGRVEIVATGNEFTLDRFQQRLFDEAPALAVPELATAENLALDADFPGFSIADSAEEGSARVQVPPDYFCCDDCLLEMQTPADRRFAYPFINCTQCGPRYTLIQRLPYDRPNTSMADFPLCEACDEEYRNPLDRRFHAEPLACPVCGPSLIFTAGESGIEGNQEALIAAATALRDGDVVAVKGVGGYHLVCDAGNAEAVHRLRQRKPRPHKPLAVMLPRDGADGLKSVRRHLLPSDAEIAALTSPVRPIVLIAWKRARGLADNLAPGLNELGVMLPYSPLHQLLLQTFGGPLVATSGNISGEPVLTDAGEVAARLNRVADARLDHNRPILRPADDPVQREIAGRVRPLRLGRGNAPLELRLPRPLQRPLLAVGGHLKNTICLAWDDRALVSPHIGDMGTPRSLDVFEQVIEDLQRLYRVRAEVIVCDRHPGYSTTRWAARHTLPLVGVWHHHAHASALVGESGQAGPWLVFAWDGVGLGADKTLWGGEALYGEPGAWQRQASWRPFRLPGGDKAGREPWRSALALCWESDFDWQPKTPVDPMLREAWSRGMNAPTTSAAGRLFDAVAAMTGVLEHASFEGQGPMYAEALAQRELDSAIRLPLTADRSGVLRSDWSPLLAHLADSKRSTADRVSLWHATAAAVIRDQARAIRAQQPVARVGLCGGVFQNRLLTEMVLALLHEARFEVFIPQRLPVNDAAISFGQIVDAAALIDA